MTKKSKSSEEKYLNKSLDKALSIIDLFDSNKDELTITEIAKRLDTKPGSIYPTLYTLEKHAYLHRDGNKKYRLGLKFLEKGSLVLEKMDLRTQARPELEKLRDETNETIHLGVLDEGEVVYIDKLEPRRAVRMYSSVGKRAPVHCTALGKVILAQFSKDELKRVVEEKGLLKYTERTITSFLTLKEELKTIRKKGYAIDDAEHEVEIRCVACPIYNHEGKTIAAISLTAPSFRISREEIEEFPPILKKYAERISKKLGYNL